MDISINDLVCYSALNFPKQRTDEHCSESKNLRKRDKEKKQPLVLHLLFSSEDSFVFLWVSAAFIYFSLSHTPPFLSFPMLHLYYIRSRSTNELHCSYFVDLLRTWTTISRKMPSFLSKVKSHMNTDASHFILKWVLQKKTSLNLLNEPRDINAKETHTYKGHWLRSYLRHKRKSTRTYKK